MKKLFLLCLVAFISITASAQFYVGGTLGAEYNKTKIKGESIDQTTFVLVPELGYKIDKCISVGANFGFGYSDNDDDELTLYEISPYIRANFAQVKSVKFFTEAALFLNHQKYSLSNDNEFSYNTWGAAIRPGFTVDVGNDIQIIARTTMLQYSKADKHGVDIKKWRIGIPNDFTVGILVNI